MIMVFEIFQFFRLICQKQFSFFLATNVAPQRFQDKVLPIFFVGARHHYVIQRAEKAFCLMSLLGLKTATWIITRISTGIRHMHKSGESKFLKSECFLPQNCPCGNSYVYVLTVVGNLNLWSEMGQNGFTACWIRARKCYLGISR